MQNKMTDDLIRLLDRALSHHSSCDLMTQRAIAKYLAAQRSPAHRERAMQLIEDGLKSSYRAVWEAVEEVFPGLDDATEWLEEKVEKVEHRSKKPKSSLAGSRDDESRRLDGYLDKFVDLAMRYPGGDPGPLVNEPGGGYDNYDGDSDDSECPKYNEPDLERGIRDWIQVLGEWPDQAGKAAVWEKVMTNVPVIVVDGALETLASRYVYSIQFWCALEVRIFSDTDISFIL